VYFDVSELVHDPCSVVGLAAVLEDGEELVEDLLRVGGADHGGGRLEAARVKGQARSGADATGGEVDRYKGRWGVRGRRGGSWVGGV
jgi:hypothetical protein